MSSLVVEGWALAGERDKEISLLSRSPTAVSVYLGLLGLFLIAAASRSAAYAPSALSDNPGSERCLCRRPCPVAQVSPAPLSLAHVSRAPNKLDLTPFSHPPLLPPNFTSLMAESDGQPSTSKERRSVSRGREAFVRAIHDSRRPVS